ncbi:MAG: HAMP domain-containing histidine kinase [Gammaproteobacteria bacterium]|nr:HAMP domain-containing histidine kinase [Gammaproteobacteria bacterium]
MEQNAEPENIMTQSDLHTIMMAVIHDTKNALFQAQGMLDQLQIKLSEPFEEVTLAQHELTTVNQSIMRLLTLYKMQTDKFSLHRDQYHVDDFLQELVLGNNSIHSAKNIAVLIECDEYLEWFFDADLLANVINSILNNTLRYTKSKIILRAEEVDQQLQISIIDDGHGFPKQMLENSHDLKTNINFKLSNSGLGLYFAEKIANMHNNNAHKGYTEISNRAEGGGCFMINLP